MRRFVKMSAAGADFKMVCFGCRRELTDAVPGHYQPSHGVAFDSGGGNYGSTVHDGCRGSLRLFVCDECVVTRSAELLGVRVNTREEHRYLKADDVLRET